MAKPVGIRAEYEIGPLAKNIDEWAELLLNPYMARFDSKPSMELKQIHDPIGKAITLHPWEVFLLDSPILQRLRFIRQLGVGHLLFPTSGYSRFEHSLGALQAATIVFDSVANPSASPSAKYTPDELNARRDIVRLAALLHDIGHCVFSHVSEKFYAEYEDVVTARKAMNAYFGKTDIAAAEVIAVVIITSPAFRKLLEGSAIRRLQFNEDEIIHAVCACITGSKERIEPDSWLAEIVNGPVDCDKVDYLSRDAHMAGVPISLDIDRLLTKLRIVQSPTISGTATHSLAIVPSGARALEEMLVSRIFLYDKFYYHPKIMAAEELIRAGLRKLAVACKEFSSPVTLLDYGDDEFLSLTPSSIQARFPKSDLPSLKAAHVLFQKAKSRDLPKRAFAFARRYIPEAPEAYSRFVNRGKSDNAPQAVTEYMELDDKLAAPGGTELYSRIIADEATKLGINAEIFVGFQSAQRAAGKMDMPVKLPDGRIDPTPDFLFNVSKWSDAYALNKQTSYVFASHDLAKVHLAAEKVFAERQMTFAPKSWVFSKLSEVELDKQRLKLPPAWIAHRLRPDYMGGAEAQELIAGAVAKFSSFLKSFHKTIGTSLVESWVSQFDDADLQDSALRLLDHITFIEKSDIIEGFRSIVEKTPNLTNAIWIQLIPRDGRAGSADLIKYDLRELEQLNVRILGNLTPSEVRKAKRIVFFDDLLNSGVQVECLLSSWFEDGGNCENPKDRDRLGKLEPDMLEAIREASTHFVYYSAHKRGRERLSKLGQRIGLNLEGTHFHRDSSDASLTLEGLACHSDLSKERFINFLRNIGKRLLEEKFASRPDRDSALAADFALGYGGLGMTLVYRHSISTATPPSLWQMSTDLIRPWLPLFPRDQATLKGILDPRAKPTPQTTVCPNCAALIALSPNS